MLGHRHWSSKLSSTVRLFSWCNVSWCVYQAPDSLPEKRLHDNQVSGSDEDSEVEEGVEGEEEEEEEKVRTDMVFGAVNMTWWRPHLTQ